MKLNKKTLVTLATTSLVSTLSWAGGGGLGSSICGYQRIGADEVVCQSKTFILVTNTVKLDRFTESGHSCPRGGEIVKRLNVTLKARSLGVNGISNPSTSTEVAQDGSFVGPMARGGLVLLAPTDAAEIEAGAVVNVVGTVEVGWGGEYEKINHQTFSDQLRCR